MIYKQELKECYDDIIVAMANHIEQLRGEISYQQGIIKALEAKIMQLRSDKETLIAGLQDK